MYYYVQIWCQFCVIGRRFENQPCFEAQFLFRASLLIASRYLIASSDLLSICSASLLDLFDCLQRACLLLCWNFSQLLEFCNVSIGRECRQLQIPILRNQCTFFFLVGQKEVSLFQSGTADRASEGVIRQSSLGRGWPPALKV